MFPPSNFPSWDFPFGPVVKNPPSNGGDVGSIPDQGTKIPHVMEHLRLSAITREKSAHHNEDPTGHN